MHTMKAFANGMVVSYESSGFISAPAGSVKLRNNSQIIGIIDFTGIKPSDCKIVVRDGGTCYSATATSSNEGSNSTWDLNLAVEKTLPSECGSSQPVPTPTPKQPTPTPTPSPEPITPSECCEDGYTTWNVTGGFTPQDHILDQVGSSKVAVLKWTFDPPGKLCADVTPNGNADVNILEPSQNVFLSDNPSVQVGIITKGLKNSGNNIYFTSADGKCYKGEWIANRDDITLTLQG